MNICICGGGNLGHACAGCMAGAAAGELRVTMLTRRPERWQQQLYLTTPANSTPRLSAAFEVSGDAAVLRQAQLVMLTMPCHVRLDFLQQHRDYISPQAVILMAPSTGGVHLFTRALLPTNPCVFCQRVPYICRIREYGHSVHLEPKPYVDAYIDAPSPAAHAEAKRCAELALQMPVREMPSPWPLMLSNSNPIIHIARLCELAEQAPHSSNPLFYEEWGDTASALSVAMDAELCQIMRALGAPHTTLLQHYGVTSPRELTQKMHTIPAFAGIRSPMVETGARYELDTRHRYFTEDVPFGTLFIKYMAQRCGIPTPHIDSALLRLQALMGTPLLTADASINTAAWISTLGFDPGAFITAPAVPS